jgi:hypothetical protein
VFPLFSPRHKQKIKQWPPRASPSPFLNAISQTALEEANADDNVSCASLSLIAHITKHDSWLAPDVS